ncbi:diguanylate cyclase domain-containing protein [Aeromonas intestinalis]
MRERIIDAIATGDETFVSSVLITEEAELQYNDFLGTRLARLSKFCMLSFIIANLFFLALAGARLSYLHANDMLIFNPAAWIPFEQGKVDIFSFLLASVAYVVFLFRPGGVTSREGHLTCIIIPHQKLFTSLVYVVGLAWMWVLHLHHNMLSVAPMGYSLLPVLSVVLPLSFICAMVTLPFYSVVMLAALLVANMRPVVELDTGLFVINLAFLMLFVIGVVALAYYVLTVIVRLEYQHFLLTKKVVGRLNLDPLLAISNRRMFFTRLEKRLSRRRAGEMPGCLMMIDVDHFKKYNDSYGHAEGDTCLQLISQGLLECTRDDMDLVARYGGEEFCVYLDGASCVEAEIVAARIGRWMREQAIPHRSSTVSEHVTLSIGIAECRLDEPPAASCERADKALYQVKARGRNGFLISLG